MHPFSPSLEVRLNANVSWWYDGVSAYTAMREPQTKIQPSFFGAAAVKAWFERQLTSPRVKFSFVWRLWDAQSEEKKPKNFSPLTLENVSCQCWGRVMKIKSWNLNLKISGSRCYIFIYVKWRPCTRFLLLLLFWTSGRIWGKSKLWSKLFTDNRPHWGLYASRSLLCHIEANCKCIYLVSYVDASEKSKYRIVLSNPCVPSTVWSAEAVLGEPLEVILQSITFGQGLCRKASRCVKLTCITRELRLSWAS